jgi:hypothetical protein
VAIQGLKAELARLECMSPEQFVKWHQENDIWALAVVQSTVQYEVGDIPEDITKVVQEFAGVFEEPTALPPHREYDHTIPLLSNVVPVNARPYRYSPLHKDEIEKQVKHLLQTGLISPSTSPSASPVLLVQKKDRTWCFCVDYRRLNSITTKNKFPMPLIEEILDELHGSKFFSRLDFRAGFHQVRMSAEDEFKTAFKTHHGRYQFKVMPFGLCNAHATFQCIINSVLAPFLRNFVIVFMDDILVYSSSLEAHVEHLRAVLSVLRDHQFYVKLLKCSFAQSELEYLCHIISVEGVATDPMKTKAMLNWPVPSNVTELRRVWVCAAITGSLLDTIDSWLDHLQTCLRRSSSIGVRKLNCPLTS